MARRLLAGGACTATALSRKGAAPAVTQFAARCHAPHSSAALRARADLVNVVRGLAAGGPGPQVASARWRARTDRIVSQASRWWWWRAGIARRAWWPCC